MKNTIIQFSLITTLIFMLNCTTSKVVKPVSLENLSQIKIDSLEIDTINKEFIKLICNNRTVIYNRILDRTEPDDTEIFNCISKKAFNGDLMAESQLIAIFPSIKYPFSRFHEPYRGEKIFQLVLNKLNRYDVKFDPEFSASIYPYSSLYMNHLTEMIESIDDMGVQDYVYKHIIHIDPKLKEMEPGFDGYNIAFAKAYWAVINDAYKKGLIKLKPYGQK